MAVATTVAWGLAAFALAAAVFALLRARSLGAQLRAALARAAREEQEGRERESAWRGRARSGQERDAFFDVSLDLLAVADLTRGSIRQLNPAWERLLGFPPADLASRPLLDLVHPDDRERTRAEVQRLRLGGSTVDFENRLAGYDGTYHWLSWRAVSVAGQGAVYATARDVSERKKLDHIKDDFISVVSHELRTPLTSIRGSLGLLAGGVGGEIPGPARELIDIAAKNSERLVRLINDILDFEKVESGAVAFRFQRIDLAALVEQAVESNRSYAQPFNVRFEVTASLSDAWVWADPDRLLQVLANLLSNAAKFSPRGDRVMIALTRSDGRLRVSVTDQGRGIPSDFQHRVFERFAQADASSTRQKGGTGLGLAISKTIVERHGGHIGFETRPAAGTTFFFDLPEWGGEAATIEVPSLGPRLLVCEDDPDAALFLRLVLEREGYEVDTAADAAEAKRKLTDPQLPAYAAMTLDLLLPDQDGLSLFRELRREPRTSRLPIVVVSARTAEGSAEWSGGAMGILDWLVKPIDPARLSVAVRRAVAAASRQEARILHVEDDPDVHQVVAAIAGPGATVEWATTLKEARARLAGERFDLVILDLVLPDGSGAELLPFLSDLIPSTPTILFSALEVGEEVSRQVASVLVKSRTSNRQLVETIQAALARQG
ncbi:MAG TPA: ATP-binding protein [Thermoanaerobaculia bacterium]|nr:ATP-binding protein [Thermoanaerobaculia bacterium]